MLIPELTGAIDPEGVYFTIEKDHTAKDYFIMILKFYIPAESDGSLIKNFSRLQHIFIGEYLNEKWGHLTIDGKNRCREYRLSGTSWENAFESIGIYLTNEIYSLVNYIKKQGTLS